MEACVGDGDLRFLLVDHGVVPRSTVQGGGIDGRSRRKHDRGNYSCGNVGVEGGVDCRYIQFVRETDDPVNGMKTAYGVFFIVLGVVIAVLGTWESIVS